MPTLALFALTALSAFVAWWAFRAAVDRRTGERRRGPLGAPMYMDDIWDDIRQAEQRRDEQRARRRRP